MRSKDDVVLNQVWCREALIVCPKPLAQPENYCARQQALSRPVLEGIFDVAHREISRQHLHGRVIQGFDMAILMLEQIKGCRQAGRVLVRMRNA